MARRLTKFATSAASRWPSRWVVLVSFWPALAFRIVRMPNRLSCRQVSLVRSVARVNLLNEKPDAEKHFGVVIAIQIARRRHGIWLNPLLCLTPIKFLAGKRRKRKPPRPKSRKRQNQLRKRLRISSISPSEYLPSFQIGRPELNLSSPIALASPPHASARSAQSGDERMSRRSYGTGSRTARVYSTENI